MNIQLVFGFFKSYKISFSSFFVSSSFLTFCEIAFSLVTSSRSLDIQTLNTQDFDALYYGFKGLLDKKIKEEENEEEEEKEEMRRFDNEEED